MSRLYKVVAVDSFNYVEVEDALGERTYASLLAYEGPAPRLGDWVVIHSGYVLERVDPEEAKAVVEEVRAAMKIEEARAAREKKGKVEA